MDSLGLTMSITALANAIAEKLNDDDLSLVAQVLVQLSDTMGTILINRERLREACLDEKEH